MAVYNSLLLKAGGSLLSDLAKADRWSEAHLFIGLGGTGRDAVKNIKKQVYQCLKSDDLDSYVPAYRNIRFLVVDQEDPGSSLCPFDLDRDTEFFDVSSQEGGRGSAMSRHAVRFLLIDKGDSFRQKLTFLIRDSLMGVTEGLTIHIFSGISGSTGGGIFIDVCYIVRHVLETLGIWNVQVSGYFFLPDVNLSMPAVENSPLIARRIKRNGYAALQELDYLMDLEEAQDSFVQNYGPFEINTSRPPVDACHLISSFLPDGARMPDGYDRAVRMAADYIIPFLAKGTLGENLERDRDYSNLSIRRYLWNISYYRELTRKRRGASFAYTFIGAASAQIPMSHTMAYLGAKLFERFHDFSDLAPAENSRILSVFTTVWDTLKNTFSQNLTDLTDQTPSQDSYTWHLLTAIDVKDQLDKEVNKLDADQESRKLMKLFLENQEEWIHQDENRIARLISHYITETFFPIIHKGIAVYLEEKYQAAGPELAQKIKEDIIQGYLYKNAEPRFWKIPDFDLSVIASSSHIFVPSNFQEAVWAAKQKQLEGVHTCLSGLTSNISLMRFRCGVPLYAYQGIWELEKTYEEDPWEPGLHLYENAEMDWRDYLPSPISASFQTPDCPSPRIAERNRKLAEELENAKKANIVYSDTCGWHIKITKTADVSKLLEEAGDYETNGQMDLLKLGEVLDTLRQARESLFCWDNVESIPLRTSGAIPSFDEAILYDNYCRYPRIETAVREQLAKLNSLNQEISRLEMIYETASEKSRKKELFFDAVFTGIFSLEQDKIVFCYNRSGAEQTLELQNASMPYGTKAPLYQAYLTYLELDQDTTHRIDEMTCYAIDHMDDEIYEISKQVQARYTSQDIKAILSKTAAEEKREEITRFYNEFLRALREHIVNYV